MRTNMDDNTFTTPPDYPDREDYEEAEREERQRSVADIILDECIEEAMMRRKK